MPSYLFQSLYEVAGCLVLGVTKPNQVFSQSVYVSSKNVGSQTKLSPATSSELVDPLPEPVTVSLSDLSPSLLRDLCSLQGDPEIS